MLIYSGLGVDGLLVLGLMFILDGQSILREYFRSKKGIMIVEESLR